MKLGNTKLSFREVFLGSLQFMNKERKKYYMQEEKDITSNFNVSVAKYPPDAAFQPSSLD